MAQRVNIEVLNKAAVDVQVQNSNAINVEVPTAPRDFVPRFTADKTDIKEGETVNFSASEAGFQYYWEIEDVGGFVFKNAKSVSHQFIDSGNFDIALTQADLNKQKAGTQIKRDFIKVVVPDFLLDKGFALGATAGYSLRRLKKSATKAIRVREDGSNTEADIGFSAGALDETALLNHVGSNNGFVTKWYDQSGNGNDASNSNASRQPKIVSSGTVIQENGQPAIQFDGSSQFLSLSKAGAFDADIFTILMVYKALSTQINQRIYDARGLGKATDDAGHSYRLFGRNGDDFVFNDLNNNIFIDNNDNTNQKIQSIFWNANQSNGTAEFRQKINSSNILSPVANNNSNVSNPASVYIDVKGGDIPTIGASNESITQYFHGKLQEFVFFSGVENEKLNNPVNNHYSIF